MNYAWVEDGIITNIVWLYSGNAHMFSKAVLIGDYPVRIGDNYIDGEFYRDGEKLLSSTETLLQENDKAYKIIEELDMALLDSTYENIIGGI